MSFLIFADAEQIVTPVSRLSPQRGPEMGGVTIWKKASLSIDPKSGKIHEIGGWKRVRKSNAKTIDAKGTIILPGFVDSHTHPVYAGSRIEEFVLRSQGKNYMEILKEGGGILSTVRATRKTGRKELTERAESVFRQMFRHGTTTVEAKTGYGLQTKEEIRQLEILRDLKKKLPVEILVTFLGAHSFPPEYRKNPDAYVDLICGEMLPLIAKKKLADFCDVFCEKGVFSNAQTEKILMTAEKFGFGLRLHADEFESTGGAELGVALKASSADHLMGISKKGILSLAKSNTAAVLLPCTSFFLGKKNYAPARQLIDAGAIVAIATDFNAGSNLSFSMQMAVSLGVLRMRMTPEEALVAATLHGAYSLNASHRIGSLHPGKEADFLLFPGNDYREIFYHFGTNQVIQTIKKGKVVA